VNEGDDKEKLEQFVNFCEDTIFEMQHAASISPKTDGGGGSSGGASGSGESIFRKAILEPSKTAFISIIRSLSPKQLKAYYSNAKGMGTSEMIKFFIRMIFTIIFFLITMVYHGISLTTKCVLLMMSGQQEIKEKEPTPPNEHLKAYESSSREPLSITYVPQQQQRTIASTEEPTTSNTQSSQENTENENKETQSEADVPFTIPKPIIKTTESLPKSQISEESEEEVLPNADKIETSGGSNVNYRKNIMEMFARNFYKLKYSALVLAFLINFLMLFFKAIQVASESGGETGGDEESTDIANIEDIEDALEIIIMDADKYYLEYVLKIFAFLHSLVAFAMMIAYYVLKVPLVIFKREKEVARKLEFDGMWIAEQPSEDDFRSHWDKLVLATRMFPSMYWDKFVKKKVKSKYMDQFDVQQLCKLLGMAENSDEYKFEASKSNKQNTSNKEEESGGILSK
jgi:ryanodine receptor 2